MSMKLDDGTVVYPIVRLTYQEAFDTICGLDEALFEVEAFPVYWWVIDVRDRDPGDDGVRYWPQCDGIEIGGTASFRWFRINS